MACLEANCHVYCEKPFAISLEDGDLMVGTADRAGLKIAVGHFHGAYTPGAANLKSEIEKGRIGHLMSFHAHGKHDHRGGGEDMMDLGTHLFNLMQYLAGEVEWMFAYVTAHGQEITPPTSMGPPNLSDRWRVTGSTGISPLRAVSPGSLIHEETKLVSMSDMGWRSSGTWASSRYAVEALSLMIYPFPLWAPSNATQREERLELTDVPPHNSHELAVMDLIEAIEEDRDPNCSGRDGVKTLEMVMGAYESQIPGRRVAFPIGDRSHPLERFMAVEAT